MALDDVRSSCCTPDRFRFILSPKCWVISRLPRIWLSPASLLARTRNSSDLVRDTVVAIDPERRRVTTAAGSFDADVLVIALGADYDLAATPGLSEADEFYSLAGAAGMQAAVDAFSSGRAVIGVCAAPYKCPPGAERVRSPAPRQPRSARHPRPL